MSMLKNKTFWIGFVTGVVVWQVALPKFAPGVKSKLPLG
jgi:hypothetical protein